MGKTRAINIILLWVFSKFSCLREQNRIKHIRLDIVCQGAKGEIWRREPRLLIDLNITAHCLMMTSYKHCYVAYIANVTIIIDSKWELCSVLVSYINFTRYVVIYCVIHYHKYKRGIVMVKYPNLLLLNHYLSIDDSIEWRT